MKRISLSFVYPMYNEIDNIEQTVVQSLAVGREIAEDFEIVVVDDASTDGSGQLAEALATKHPEVKVIHHQANKRLGGTLRTGFATASKEYILYIDSDLPLDFNDVKLTIPMIEDADMLIGYRLTRDEGIRRKIISRGYNNLIRVAFGLHVRDVNFSFKLFRRSIIDRVNLGSDGSFIDAELLLEAKRIGCRIKEVGLPYYPRVSGKSTLAGIDTIIGILEEMWAYRQRTRTEVAATRENVKDNKTTHR